MNILKNLFPRLVGDSHSETTWSVGTLVYNKRQLVILFVWLMWMAGFYALSGAIYMKVYFNWKKRRGKTPVPHAG